MVVTRTHMPRLHPHKVSRTDVAAYCQHGLSWLAAAATVRLNCSESRFKVVQHLQAVLMCIAAAIAAVPCYFPAAAPRALIEASAVAACLVTAAWDEDGILACQRPDGMLSWCML